MSIYFIFQMLSVSALLYDNHILLTEQEPEILLYEQDTFYLYGDYRHHFPLGALFLNDRYKERLENLIDTTCWASSCSRAFSGTWSIVNDKLYLKRLQYCCDGKEIPLDKVFKKGKIKNHGVRAFWVTEELSVSDKHFVIFDIAAEIYEGYKKEIKWYNIKIDKAKVKYFEEK